MSKETLFDEGKNLFKLQHYNEALVAFETALLFTDKDDVARNGERVVRSMILFAKGEVLFELKRYREARASYEEAIERDYSYEKTYRAKSASLLNEAKRLYNAELYQQAGEAYRRAILFDRDPIRKDTYKDSGRDLLVKALGLYESGQLEEAINLYEQAILFDPSNAKVSIVRGRRLDELNQNYKNLSDTDLRIFLGWDDEDEDERSINYVDMIAEGYKGKRKTPYIEAAEETPDPDEYDNYYNEIYDPDYGN